ncbi:hypothetical protein MXB_2882 [Myxobolus squamalis]|nr:hypothetical protein MXB_2882 [Myxobolus squamalis]
MNQLQLNGDVYQSCDVLDSKLIDGKLVILSIKSCEITSKFRDLLLKPKFSYTLERIEVKRDKKLLIQHTLNLSQYNKWKILSTMVFRGYKFDDKMFRPFFYI